MKKKIFGAVVVVAIAVGAMINVNLNKVSNKGDLTMANVEALAQEQWYQIPGANQTGVTYGQEVGSKQVLTGNGVITQPYTVTTTTITGNGTLGVTGTGISASVGGSYSYQVQQYSVQSQGTYTTVPCCNTVTHASSCGFQSC